MHGINRVLALFGLAVGAAMVYADDIQLPSPQKTGGMSLMAALNARQTQRTFSARPLSEQQLANLLWAAAGINGPDNRRTASGANDSPAIDVYVALSSGVYLYQAQSNLLVQIRSEDLRTQFGKQPITQNAPVSLIYVADTDRMKSDPGFYSAADTGFISQNVCLYCASEGLHTTVLGISLKDLLAAALKLTPAQQIILTQPVGFPPDTAGQ